MKRLKWYLLIFFAALAIPLAYVTLRTYAGLQQEESAKLRFFADTLFDQMERELTAMVLKEEARAVDEYNYTYIPDDPSQARQDRRSPLSWLPGVPYILGYFQNNPDGSFQSPLITPQRPLSKDRRQIVARLENANQRFNAKRYRIAARIRPPPQAPLEKEKTVKKEQKDRFADKYLKRPLRSQAKTRLGQKEKRIEQITLSQAKNIARQALSENEPVAAPMVAQAEEAPADIVLERLEAKSAKQGRRSPSPAAGFQSDRRQINAKTDGGYLQFQAEVAPLQAVFINDDELFVFRRIVIDSRIYRQGFILLMRPFLQHLAETHFALEPMAQFTELRLNVLNQTRTNTLVRAGRPSNLPELALERVFPPPFAFLSAVIRCDRIPPATGRQTLNIMVAVLAGVLLLGLLAIYQSVRTVVDLSERRSRFVSSVTHELKTPLTNIRMYIEMLEQGIARDPQKEQDYLQILGAESTRLSRLIHNVLELSRLEKKQRPVDLKPHRFEQVVAEIQALMGAKLTKEGFTLKTDIADGPPFKFDREIMLQVLMNLIENSLKFGHTAPIRQITLSLERRSQNVQIALSDTGPGIPKKALKKVFDDFYRATQDRSQRIGGTGIGLALVKKYVTAMGGNVSAVNNDGPGCTVRLTFGSRKK